jgi:hypothetical protein
MSQLSEVRTAVQGNWPTNYHSSFLTNAKADEYINSVVRWVCRGTIITADFKIINHSFKWQKKETTTSTVDAQQRYELPAASSTIWRYKREISCELVNSDNYRVYLTRKLKRDIEIDPTHQKTTDDGIPHDYCVDHGYIWLYPIPDHDLNSGSAWTINLEYYGYPPALSGDTDTNELTNFHPEILEYGATELGFRYGQDYEQAEYYKNLKIEKFVEMLREDQAEVLANLDMGIQPIAGSCLSDGGPGYSNTYNNPTPYD